MFDPNPNATVDLFAQLLSWLKRNPSDTAYNYGSACDCLLMRYMRGIGYENFSLDDTHVRFGRDGFSLPIPAEVRVAVRTMPWTYEHVVDRLEGKR